MFLERIVSEGLAHYSYFLADGWDAVVIDPRRDVEIYLELAQRAGVRIRAVLETHRHEDFVLGSLELAGRTGAPIGHADAQLPYAYGEPVQDGQTWTLGSLTLRAISTPGHTPGSMSYLLETAGGQAWMVFTGDTLFSDEVGRVDFFGPEMMTPLAEQLYTSLTEKLLPLGSGVLVWPAHSAGSLCGGAITDRPWTTLGLERRLNPRLQYRSRADFVAAVARTQPRPPYLERVELWNVQGAPRLSRLPAPRLLTPAEFADAMPGAQIVDTRDGLAFAAAHVPGALALDNDHLPALAGWFLDVERPILLVTDDDPGLTTTLLRRLGFDDVIGYMQGLDEWIWAGRPTQPVGLVRADALRRELAASQVSVVVDVRTPDEVAQGTIPGALAVPLIHLPQRLADVPRGPVTLYCGGGPRSLLAASYLQRAGWPDVRILLGGMAAWHGLEA